MPQKTTDLDDEKARPKGDTGKGKTGVPPGEQGISNREGDTDDDEFEEDEDDAEDEEEESKGG